MTPSPLENFLELIRKSGLIDPSRLTAYLEKLGSVQTIPHDPKDLIDCMIRDAMICQFQADQLLAGKWRGFYVGKYKVLERIGIGGMGQVYLAEHRTMRRRVAIKVLPRAKSNEPSALERFDREARAGGTLDHPNFVRSYDKDQEGDLHYLVMEFVDGASLSEIVKISGPMQPERAAHYMYQTTKALEYAHNLGLIHRDIKPANILIDRQGLVKILDMGLARFFNDQDDNITRKYDETVLGTADYLSPEQAIDSHAVDTRTDLYSLGCTYYFAMAGVPPFDEGSVSQKLLWHQTRKPKSLVDIIPGFPVKLSDIIDRLLAKKPGDRYQTAAELEQEIREFGEMKIPPPSEEELPKLSPLARRIIATLDGLGQPAIPATTAEDDSRNRINLGLSTGPSRGGDSSTVSMQPDPSSEHPSLPTPVKEAAPASQPVATPENPFADFDKPRKPSLFGPSKETETAPAVAPSAKPILKQPVSPPRSPTAHKAQGPPAPFVPQTQGRVTVRTKPAIPPGQSAQSARSSSKSARPLWPLLVAAAVSSFALIGILIFVFWNRGPGEKPALPDVKNPSGPKANETKADMPRGPRTIRVASQKIADVDHTTISAALKEARSGDIIQIIDQQIYAESLNLINTSAGVIPSNLTIQADIAPDGKRARLMPPEGHPADVSLIRIGDTDHLTIRGLLIDGNDQVNRNISITKRNRGLILEDLRIESFVGSGIEFKGAQAVQFRDAELNKLWIRSRRKEQKHSFAGISISADPGGSCDGIIIRRSLIEGPFEYSLAVQSPVQRLLVENCKFYGIAKGCIHLGEQIPVESRMGLTIQNNTIWQAKSALSLQSKLDPDQCLFVFRNQLIYQVDQLIQTSTIVVPNADSLKKSISGMGNVYDEKATKPGNANLLPGIQFKTLSFTLSTEPADMLNYHKSSPLATAGEGDKPVGAQ